MAASMRSSCAPVVSAVSGKRFSVRSAGSRGCPSRLIECRVAGLSSTNVSPAVAAVNRMTVRESKVSSPPVRSRSIVYRCTSRNWARVCASSRVSTDMRPCCRTGWAGRRRVLPTADRRRTARGVRSGFRAVPVRGVGRSWRRYGPRDGLIAFSAVSGAAVRREGSGRTGYGGAGVGTALAGVGGRKCAEPVGVGFDEVGDVMEQPGAEASGGVLGGVCAAWWRPLRRRAREAACTLRSAG